MRKTAAVALAVALAATLVAQQSESPFSITLKTTTPVVKSGSEVFIQLLMTNTSDHDVDCTAAITGDLDRAYDYEVRGSDGALAPNIDRSGIPEDGGLAGRSPQVIRPGQTRETGGAYINQYYDMRTPGQYTIQVSRRVSKDPKDGVVKSNKITITVLPTDATPPTAK